MKHEPRVLDDAARTAGIAGPGLPVRAGKETFLLGRFTREIRNRHVARVRERYEEELRHFAGIDTQEKYARRCDDYAAEIKAGKWGYGGECYNSYGDTHEMTEELVRWLLELHHPGIELETVSWLMSLWDCPACNWRGVRPVVEAGTRCRNCHKEPPAPAKPPPPAEGENPYSVGQGYAPPPPQCCKRADQQPYFRCPACGKDSGAEIESVQRKLFAGIRELQSADPRTPSRGCGSNGVDGAAPSTSQTRHAD